MSQAGWEVCFVAEHQGKVRRHFSWRGMAADGHDAAEQGRDAFKTAHAIIATAQDRAGEPFPGAWERARAYAQIVDPDTLTQSWGIGAPMHGEGPRSATQREEAPRAIKEGASLVLESQRKTIEGLRPGEQASIAVTMDDGGTGILKHAHCQASCMLGPRHVGKVLSTPDQRALLAFTTRFIALCDPARRTMSWVSILEMPASATLRAAMGADHARDAEKARLGLAGRLRLIGAGGIADEVLTGLRGAAVGRRPGMRGHQTPGEPSADGK